ncbi:hypothetical protein M3Y98_00900600 [Aphelenchoides besseyi]|nr:hypothetical protein M3Y98_00900600 [Aphelenchoides besseyi]KAI6193628.1 hypothetical protein M3Y96_01038900 [Aphelenchoides besseyi]
MVDLTLPVPSSGAADSLAATLTVGPDVPFQWLQQWKERVNTWFRISLPKFTLNDFLDLESLLATMSVGPDVPFQWLQTRLHGMFAIAIGSSGKSENSKAQILQIVQTESQQPKISSQAQLLVSKSEPDNEIQVIQLPEEQLKLVVERARSPANTQLAVREKRISGVTNYDSSDDTLQNVSDISAGSVASESSIKELERPEEKTRDQGSETEGAIEQNNQEALGSVSETGVDEKTNLHSKRTQANGGMIDI